MFQCFLRAFDCCRICVFLCCFSVKGCQTEKNREKTQIRSSGENSCFRVSTPVPTGGSGYNFLVLGWHYVCPCFIDVATACCFCCFLVRLREASNLNSTALSRNPAPQVRRGAPKPHDRRVSQRARAAMAGPAATNENPPVRLI